MKCPTFYYYYYYYFDTNGKIHYRKDQYTLKCPTFSFSLEIKGSTISNFNFLEFQQLRNKYKNTPYMIPFKVIPHGVFFFNFG